MKNLVKGFGAFAFIVLMSLMFVGSYAVTHPDAQIGIVHLIVTAVLIFAASLFLKPQTGILQTAFSTTELVAMLGDYCRKFRDVIISELLLPLDLYEDFTVMDDIKDEMALPNATIADLIQPMDYVNFDATGNAISFGSRMLKVRDWKIDLLLYPKALEKTYLGLMNKKGSDPLQLPLESFIMQKIVAKAKENLRLQSIYQGVYDAAGSTPIDVMDGLLIKLAIEADNGNIDPVVTGAITANNVVDKLLLVYDNLGDPYKQVPIDCPVNSQIFDWYVRKFTPVVNGSLATVTGPSSVAQMNRIQLTGTNCVLKREPGLGTSQAIIMTQKENKFYGTDSVQDIETIRVQEFNRSIKIMIDGKSGVEFGELRADADGNIPLSVNDQLPAAP